MRHAAYQRYRRPGSPPPPPPPPPLSVPSSDSPPPAGAGRASGRLPERGSSALFVSVCALAGLAFGFGTFAFAFGANIHVDGNAGADASQILGAMAAMLSVLLLPGLILLWIAVSTNQWEARLAFGLGALVFPLMMPVPQTIAPVLLFTVAIAAMRRSFRRFPWDAVALLYSATFITLVLYAETTR